jgi:hypothetical protein
MHDLKNSSIGPCEMKETTTIFYLAQFVLQCKNFKKISPFSALIQHPLTKQLFLISKLIGL